MRYAYALTTAILLGGAATALTLNQPAGAQTAQNEPGTIAATAPRPGAPMSFADMVAKLQPAVVNISTTQRVKVESINPFAGTPFEQFGPRGGPTTQKSESLGSGFIISADGYVVTNNHVISAGNQKGVVVESITVTLPDRREFKARLIGNDTLSDLAVLKIDGQTNLPFVKFGDSNATRVGDWVVAIGNPFGLGGSVTAGIVSAVHRAAGQFDRFIQTDASINRGNSGGPMFDLNGNVIGINSQILSPTGGNVGIGFAIPADQAKPIIATLMKGDAVKRGYLGVSIQALSPDIADAFGVQKGLGELITDVRSGEAAEKAGIKRGDIVVKIGDKDVTPDQTLSLLTSAIAPGTRVPFVVVRDGQRLTIPVTLGTRPPEDKLRQLSPSDSDSNPGGGDLDSMAAASLGLKVVPITPSVAYEVGIDPSTKGVIVAGVAPNSDAASKIQRLDVILSVNRKPVTNAADIAAIVAEAKKAGRSSVALYIQRRIEGQVISQFVPVEIPR
ncbi:Do family serine endopeptidase [Sphingomonas soli]|uniref:Do family serine endopeptidase n=1 Tax=Sphingomonas soli TaxID=266127 RepID=UPI00082DB316|nr:Do family serine endopeptidase [Sphingomonas soli]